MRSVGDFIEYIWRFVFCLWVVVAGRARFGGYDCVFTTVAALRYAIVFGPGLVVQWFGVSKL